MSLIKQLWLAIALLMLLAFGGSFTVSILTTRTYMQEQLLLKNQDNANSLASVLGQMPKDPVTIELLVTSQFDLGNYEYIRITDPEGQLLIERVNTAGAAQVPAWFQRAVTFSVSPGIAQVQDGWSQYGTLEIASHSRFAYRAMWRSTLQLLSWFLGAALLAGITGTMMLRFILRPLGAVVTQAEAISDRRFITTKEPSTLEFQTVVRSMNALSTRVKQLLEDESRRLQQRRV
jgi:methyl-accepting chemotaxis protein